MYTPRFSAVRLQRFWPTHIVGELLTKSWIDTVIPVVVMILVLVTANWMIPGYLDGSNLTSIGRQFAEFAIIALGMAIVVFCGGIDLSVGVVYALANLTAIYLINVMEMPVWAVVPLVLLVGAGVGALNGFLIGMLKIRAFLVTLATMVIFRAVVQLLLQKYGDQINSSYVSNDTWDFLGTGSLVGMPVNVVALIVIAIIIHILHTRSKMGWHVQAVGGGRKSAHQAGIAVRSTVFGAYVACSLMAALAGLFYAARQGSISYDTGVGMEISVIAAIVLGGVALGGGRGSVMRALAGSVIVLVLTNMLIRMGYAGGATAAVLGIVLLAAITFDVKWEKNRHKILQKSYVSPAFNELAVAPAVSAGSGTPYEINDRLANVDVLALGLVDGPEDVILDRQGRLYTGMRQGWIYRFSGPDFSQRELFAVIGGRPLGLAFDKDENLIVCVASMGLYGVRPNGEVYKISDRTNRSLFSVLDDSSIRFADDLDIAPDGKIYFSEGSLRYDMHSWIFDGLEGRPNGRILMFDPETGKTKTVVRKLIFPNGICASHDGKSILFAETYRSTISRLWISGPKAGQTERVISNLPGHPDNINRASDGTYWLALVGVRTPIWDLASEMPGFRLRMVKRIPRDEWLAPNLNRGCVVKFSEDGEILDCMWDANATNNPAITSMREHEGWLYLGGLTSNRITRIRLPSADPDWTGPENYWPRKEAGL